MVTPFGRLLAEALAVGVGLVTLFLGVHLVFMRVFLERAMTNHSLLAVQVGLSGALFHVLSEYVGLNEWYCQRRK